jgi:hypothetical protein
LENEVFLLNAQDFVFTRAGGDTELIFPQTILELGFLPQQCRQSHL